jgi:type I restriction enzyme S subunit
MNNYNFIKLNQLCSKITDGSHYSPKGIDSGIPMLSVKDMEDNSFSYADCKYISNEDYLDLIKSDCKPLLNDILIAKDGSYLKHVFVIRNEIEQAVLSSIGILRPNLKKIVPEYLKYYLQTKSVKETVAKKYVSGSALPRIILKNFGEIDVIYKNIETQQKIASVLSALDSKIELNNRINAELEAMAKTLYDYWFVQFDFPFDFAQGKPNANGKPYKSSGGKMVWNEELKREIPEGWENGTFANYCPSTGGFAFKSNWWTDKGVAVAKIKDIQENYTLDTSDLARVDISDKEIDDKFLAKPGDVLIAMTGATVGKYAIVPITDYPIYVNQRVGYFNLGIDPSQKLPFLINSMNQSYFRNAIFTLANGAAQPNISNEQINSIQLLIPEDKLINTFNEMFQPYYKKILNNQLENQKLTELRDWLLPMLMNGQVKVMDEMENELSLAAEPKIEYGK